MARRPPMKIAPSPSETPEHEAVRERERSSAAVQAKLREERAADKSIKSEKDSSAAPKSTARPKRKKPTPAAVVPETSKPVETIAPKTVEGPKRVEQRISVGVPISLSTSNAMTKAASKLGTDVDYIKSALAPKARTAFLNRADADGLKATSKAMKLLFDQRLDNGVDVMTVKLAINADIETRARAFIADPLDAISINRLVAAFVGAEFEELVKAL